MWDVCGTRYILSILAAVISFTLQFCSPLIMKLIIIHIREQKEEAWKGYLYVALMFTLNLTQSLMNQHYLRQCILMAQQVREH